MHPIYKLLIGTITAGFAGLAGYAMTPLPIPPIDIYNEPGLLLATCAAGLLGTYGFIVSATSIFSHLTHELGGGFEQGINFYLHPEEIRRSRPVENFIAGGFASISIAYGYFLPILSSSTEMLLALLAFFPVIMRIAELTVRR